MELLKRIISDIRKGENIDLYFFVVAALVLAILNGLGLASKNLVESVTLALLGLLASYCLGIRDKLNGINEKLSGTRSLLYDEFPPNLKNAIITDSKEVFIVGITLNRTMATFYSQLERKLKDGRQIKVLLVDPNGDATNLIPRRIYRPISDQRVREKILDSISLISNLKLLAPKQIEVRVIDYPISFGCFASDIESGNGLVCIEYYSLID
jgi:hypothetical protein